MANPHKLQVGQKLFLVTRMRNDTRTREVEIGKLGRKWFTLSDGYSNERFSTETLVAENNWGGTTTTCYLSESHWLTKAARRKAEEALRRLFSTFSRPSLSHLSITEIEEITAKLSGKPKDTQ